MTPNSLLVRRSGEANLVYRAGSDQVELCERARSMCRLPSGHPEGFLGALATLYLDFAAAIRAGESQTAKHVPGIRDGLRGMAFVEAVLASDAAQGASVPLKPNAEI